MIKSYNFEFNALSKVLLIILNPELHFGIWKSIHIQIDLNYINFAVSMNTYYIRMFVHV